MNEQRLYGLSIEKKIISYLDGRLFKELNPKWKKHVKRMFPRVKDDSVINAKRFPDKTSKPDIIIEVDGTEKFVSIKTGEYPSMHHESYHSFQRFLKSKKVSIRTLQIIRFYHYGESKKIGNVDNPFTQEEMIEKYSPYFLQASKELDDDKLIKAVVNRCIIIGTSSGKTPIDYLYYGDLEHGNLLSRKDIYSIVLAYREHGKSPIHFGGLNYNPNSRKLGSRDRNYVRIKWSILAFLYYCNDEQLEKMKRGKFSSSDLHSPASAH